MRESAFPARPLTYLSQASLLAAVYFVAARASLVFAIPPGYATAVWPPSGIALAAVLLFGKRVWPGIWIGAVAANLAVESSVFAAVLIGCGNTLEALVGEALIRRSIGIPRRFERGDDVVRFVVLCSLGPAVAATVAWVPLALGHPLSWDELLRNWWTWWQGDTTGIIIVTPMILSWNFRDVASWSARKKVEAICFALALFGTAWAVVGQGAAYLAPFSLTFLTLPFILWAAFRFGQREVTTAIGVVCAAAVLLMLERRDLLEIAPLNELLLLLLTFTSMVVVTGLVLVATLAERGRAVDELRARRDALEMQVQERTSELDRAKLARRERVEERGSLHDSEERFRLQGQLAFLAEFDPLTGLPNRHMLHNRLTAALTQARDSGGLFGCMVVDLDRFKLINDTYGHRIGDVLLNQLGGRLRRCVRSVDTVGRWGGDEFVVVLSDLAHRSDAASAAQKIVDALADPFMVAGRETCVSASIGISVHPEDGADVDTLLKNADTAMYRAKEQGRNNFQFFQPAMDRRPEQRLEIETGLRGALERNEFFLHYQPKVDLATGAISGFEALLRWRHPERGLIPPVEFVPILEDNGAIIPVGEWVLRSVCEQVKAWRGQGITPRPVSVNVSARQFQRKSFDAALARVIRETGVDPACVQLELTESLLMHDAAEAERTLADFKALGLRIAVDDFGTGYSSLAYLKRFPIDELKIDRAFVRDVVTDPNDAAIALAIINLAHTLKLKAVAEGVETEEQLRFFREHGCDEIQGYYFGGPMTIEECTRMMVEDRRLSAAASDVADNKRI